VLTSEPAARVSALVALNSNTDTVLLSSFTTYTVFRVGWKQMYLRCVGVCVCTGVCVSVCVHV
jgi:hypothetical protein